MLTCHFGTANIFAVFEFALAEFARNTRKLMYREYFHFYSIIEIIFFCLFWTLLGWQWRFFFFFACLLISWEVRTIFLCQLATYFIHPPWVFISQLDKRKRAACILSWLPWNHCFHKQTLNEIYGKKWTSKINPCLHGVVSISVLRFP